MKEFLMSCLYKTGVFIGLLFLVLFLFGCSESQDLPAGEMVVFEVENPENNMWQTFTIGDDQVDQFEVWQDWQKNKLEQAKWDAYMSTEA